MGFTQYLPNFLLVEETPAAMSHARPDTITSLAGRYVIIAPEIGPFLKRFFIILTRWRDSTPREKQA
jgi:hypothetical protein